MPCADRGWVVLVLDGDPAAQRNKVCFLIFSAIGLLFILQQINLY